MRLIDTSTLKLIWFPKSPPPYAILSHTWGDDEVTFADYTDLSTRETKGGFRKIKRICKQALKDGFGYAWVDTCCINKESSSELSEAINSMFRWYRDATICYAYLEDFSEDIELPITSSLSIKHCRWFTRGWTLQELLAARDIVFFGTKWVTIGRKTELSGILEEITGIPCAILTGNARLDQVSVANRMNWAATRETTREEDLAYCLMGIFDVNMPMMYGEGRKAFTRLQEEILKQTQDDSLFAWRASEESASAAPYRGLFASSPKEFASEVATTPFFTSMASPSTILGNGQISLSCALYHGGFLGLKCFRGTEISSVVCIRVISTGSNHFLRANPSELVLKPHQYPATFPAVVFDKFAEIGERSSLDDIYQRDGLHLARLPPEISLMQVYPKKYKDFENTMKLPIVYLIGHKIALHFAVDRNASGADLFQQIGWGRRDELVSNKDIGILLVIWAEQQTGRMSYTYYIDLITTKAEDAESKFIGAKKPPEPHDKNEIAIGWSTLRVTGGQATLDGHQIFSLQLNISVNKDLKIEAETVKARIELEEKVKREREHARLKAKKARRGLCVLGVFLFTVTASIVTPVVLGYNKIS